MMKQQHTLFLLALAAAALAAAVAASTAPTTPSPRTPSTGARVAMEPESQLPAASLWRRGERVAATEPLRLRFVVPCKRACAELHEAALAVSDPRSARYGKHLSRDEVTEMTGDAESTREVAAWLARNIPHRYVRRIETAVTLDSVVVELPAADAERLLEAEFYYFEHTSGDLPRLARSAVGYTLPAEIAERVAFVGGVVHFPRRTLPSVEDVSGDGDGDGLVVDPHVLRKLYSVGDAASTSANNSQSIAQFLGQYVSKFDVAEFFDLFFWPARGDVPKIVGKNGIPPGTESMLDTEYIMSLGLKTPTTWWGNGGLHANQEPFLTWSAAVMADNSPPLVNSVSYGDQEESLSQSYATEVSNNFAKMAARGLSVMFASGDDGTGCNGTSFIPNFPASSPWVTAVGGTALGPLESGPEVTNSLSGGGFSLYFDEPKWQTDAVAGFFKTTPPNELPPQKYYVRGGRGYPDVAACSSGFVIVIDGIPMPGIAGTSCAAPTFSGIVSLLNDIRLQDGKPSLGFLNPLLYQNPSVLNDITKDCQNANGCGQLGFCAVTGWDPATGLGSPDYERMAALVKTLP